uniref:Uncharacterized protein n=1 Tax=Anguilla anguilla TaxID=7936 RepID=A0A0E9RA94_ANGAN
MLKICHTLKSMKKLLPLRCMISQPLLNVLLLCSCGCIFKLHVRMNYGRIGIFYY